MKTYLYKIRLFAYLAILIVLLGCSDNNTSGPNDNSTIEPTYNVEYTSKTKIIDDESVIISLDTASKTYTFDISKFGSEPEVGDIILVKNQIMRKVKSVNSQSGEFIVETEDAALTEVIKNGEIAWDIQPEWSNVSSLKLNGDKVLDLGAGLTEVIESTISYGGIDHKIKIEPQEVGGVINSCKFTFQMVKKIAGDAKVVFTAEGNVTLPNQSTSISISEGELQSFKANNDGLKADLELSLAAAGGSSGEHSLELPGVALSIPIRFIPTPSGPIPIPIPISIDIGIQFVSKLTIPDAKSSATATSKCSLSADGGFEYKGTEVATKGSLGDNKITDGTFDAAANIGIPIDVQFGVAFPRVGLNIAGQELAYVHTGFTTGSSLNWGPVCKRGYVKMVVEGGYELKVLGRTLAEKKKIFAEKEKVAKGDGCD